MFFFLLVQLKINLTTKIRKKKIIHNHKSHISFIKVSFDDNNQKVHKSYFRTVCQFLKEIIFLFSFVSFVVVNSVYLIWCLFLLYWLYSVLSEYHDLIIFGIVFITP